MKYSIVIPVYNESDKITSSLTQVLGFMRTFESLFEVIVSDDGSTDKTADLVQDYAQNNSEVRLLKTP
jgi:glycosyltransferase involved in cell wall biosynthesis